jgi:hypothetical protein
MTKDTFNGLRVNDKLATLYDHLVAIRKCQDCNVNKCIDSQAACNKRFTRIEIALLLIGTGMLFIISVDERMLSTLSALLKFLR